MLRRIMSAAGLILFLSQAVPANQPECKGPQFWQVNIDKFVQADGENFPPANAVLFMGSSSIRFWDLKKYFPDLLSINRGFGGSCIAESAYFLDQIAVPYKPRLIVLYSGENDVATQPVETPEQIAADLEKFMSAVDEKLPGTPIIYLSIKPSPARWALWPKSRETNKLLKTSCERRPDCRFLDVSSVLLGEDGKPNPELYHPEDGGLHLNDQGYELWTGLLAPLLEKH
jgi:lysophospholipase L1-like esterase